MKQHYPSKTKNKTVIFSAQAIVLFLTIWLLMFSSNGLAQSQRPNVIFILADDVGYKTLTCNGGNLYSTPNLDTMAQLGMRFTQCHASPVCSPSRFMLLTGKYNFRNYTQWGVMDRGQRTIGNMMKDAGYKTACYGKWQFDGGDQSVHTFGFDNYCLFNAVGISEKGFRYKNPSIYQNGKFLPDSETVNKYGEDIFTDSVLNFIDSNKSQPFFVYYPMVLAHNPFCPTPDDTAFDTWDPTQKSDTAYYPSMVKYMDKKIGQIIDKVKSLGIENNTVIIFTGDNGTLRLVSDYINEDTIVVGGKGKTTEAGTHVPLIVYWPGTIAAATVNNDLIDFTDFLPTLAGIANIPVPNNYGPLDGVSFAPRLTGQAGTPRNWIFNHYDIYPGFSNLKRWAQTQTYKLYDTSSLKPKLLFYNIVSDKNEKQPIRDSLLSPTEVVIKQQLLDVIHSYVAQGVPLFSTPAVLNITDTTAIVNDSIQINGGSTITASGAVWAAVPGATLLSGNYTSDGPPIGSIKSTIKGLLPNTVYYARAYATNYAGTNYGREISFRASLIAPHASAATSIDSTHFTANWNASTWATSYSLDVSTSSAFATSSPSTLTEGFNNGIIQPIGWFISKGIAAHTGSFGSASPSLQFKTSKSQVITPVLTAPSTQLSFWIRGLNTDTISALLVEGFNGTKWITIEKITNLPKNKSGVIKTYNASSTPVLANNFTLFRFTYTKSAGSLLFDDVSINYTISNPSFVPGYNNLIVNDTSKNVTGLTPGTNYYYRVRAMSNDNISDNSNKITATTCSAPLLGFNATNISCNGDNNGSVVLNVTGGTQPLAYNWTGSGGFTATTKDVSNLIPGTYHVIVTSNSGCTVDTSIILTEPTVLVATASADTIRCHGSTTTLTVTATGGTGTYHYTLSDGTNTTGPQDDSTFTIIAGNYTVTVTDDNGCHATTSSVQVTEPLALTASVSAGTISCNGGTTTLTVTATGGTGNYHYTLSNGTNSTGPQDGNTFTVAAGNYTVIVTDDNGCIVTTSEVQVSEPLALTASASAGTISCIGGTTTLTVTASGGTGNYHYTLSNGTITTGPQDGNTFTVAAGNYTVTVKDDNQCSSNLVTITIKDGKHHCFARATDMQGQISSGQKLKTRSSWIKLEVFPNPTEGQFTLSLQSNSNEKVEIRVMDTYGRAVYQTTGFGNKNFHFGQKFSPGVYFVTVMQGTLMKTLKIVKIGD